MGVLKVIGNVLVVVLIFLLSIPAYHYICLQIEAANPVVHLGDIIDVSTNDGKTYKINTFCEGPEESKYLIFVMPGSTVSYVRYLEFMRYLSKKGLRSCTYDRVGRMFSHIPKEGEYNGKDMIQLVNEMHQVFNHVHKDHKPVIMVGHSLGGPLVAAYTLVYPEDIKGLVLLDAAPLVLAVATEEGKQVGQYLAAVFENYLLPMSKYGVLRMLGTVGSWKKSWQGTQVLSNSELAVISKYANDPAHFAFHKYEPELRDIRKYIEEKIGTKKYPLNVPVSIILAEKFSFRYELPWSQMWAKEDILLHLSASTTTKIWNGTEHTYPYELAEQTANRVHQFVQSIA